MIFNDINKLTDKEATKDSLFKSMVGFGRDPDMTAEESLRAAHDFKSIFQQPAIFDVANSRPTTDAIHVPDQGFWDRAQTYAISQLEGKHPFVEVFDSEIFDVRVASGNSLSQGDAAQKVLHLKLVQNWQETCVSDEAYMPPEVIEAAYCAVRKSTSYYFRPIL